MVIIFSKFQVPSSYGFGMVEKLHVRGISSDNIQYFSIAWRKALHKGGERGQKKDVHNCRLQVIVAKLKQHTRPPAIQQLYL